jgi:hypothetical protein
MASSPVTVPRDILLSYRTRREIGAIGQARRYGEGAHSYLAVASYFMDFLNYHGISVTQAQRPELVPPPSGDSAHFHLSINPAEEFRVARGFVNISYIFWEYDQLLTRKTVAPDRSMPLDNMSDMYFALSIADKAWVSSSYAQQVLARDGIASSVVPTPIKIPNERNYQNRAAEKAAAASFLKSVPCFPWQFLTPDVAGDPELMASVSSFVGAVIEREAKRNGKIFFSLFNPLDPRKNFPLLVTGWRAFRKSSNVPCTLFVKLSTPNGQADALEIVRHHIPGMMSDYGQQTDLEAQDVYIIFDSVPDRKMAAVRRATDFYVAVSFCEGQNLPLAEFTLAGALPISPRNTSLADFISHDGALVIESQRAPVPPGICRRYGFKGMHWFPCDFDSYVLQLALAASLTDEQFALRSQRAIETVIAYCGYEAVWEKFMHALSEARASSVANTDT